MFSSEIIHALRKYKNILSHKVENPQFLIWGSFARGEQHDGSDLDVVVISKSFTKMPKHIRENLLFKSCISIEVDIDPWGATPKELKESHPATLIGIARDSGVLVKI